MLREGLFVERKAGQDETGSPASGIMTEWKTREGGHLSQRQAALLCTGQGHGLLLSETIAYVFMRGSPAAHSQTGEACENSSPFLLADCPPGPLPPSW